MGKEIFPGTYLWLFDNFVFGVMVFGFIDNDNGRTGITNCIGCGYWLSSFVQIHFQTGKLDWRKWKTIRKCLCRGLRWQTSDLQWSELCFCIQRGKIASCKYLIIFIYSAFRIISIEILIGLALDSVICRQWTRTINNSFV